jgi:hypothetical protein
VCRAPNFMGQQPAQRFLFAGRMGHFLPVPFLSTAGR